MLKHTPSSHPDHPLLQDALRISQNFLSSINEEITPRRQSMTVKKGEVSVAGGYSTPSLSYRDPCRVPAHGSAQNRSMLPSGICDAARYITVLNARRWSKVAGMTPTHTPHACQPPLTSFSPSLPLSYSLHFVVSSRSLPE